MKDYFKSKIGQLITHAITTGDTFFTKVYKRQYNIEVLALKGNQLIVDVNSYDIVPSGYKHGGSDIHHGEVTVDISKRTKTLIISEIICKADSKFINEYKITAI